MFFFLFVAGDNDKETSSDEIMATATTTVTASVTETERETEQHREDDEKTENDDDANERVESSSSESVSKLLLTSSGLNNHNKNNTSSSSKSVKKPNLDKVVEKINHNNKKEITSISSCNSISVSNNNNNNNTSKSSSKNFKMSELIGSDDKDAINGNHSEPEMADEEDEVEERSQHNATAALAAAQQLMGANPAMFSPAMFPTGQAFQNVVAQFTANAVANNMDVDNVGLLKSALFTLQQQQFLQFQLIQHLHSQLLRNNGGERVDENNEAERSETESEILTKRDEEAAAASRRASSANKSLSMQYDSPLKRLEEQSARQELDLR